MLPPAAEPGTRRRFGSTSHPDHSRNSLNLASPRDYGPGPSKPMEIGSTPIEATNIVSFAADGVSASSPKACCSGSSPLRETNHALQA